MSPHADDVHEGLVSQNGTAKSDLQLKLMREPLKYSGSLDQYQRIELTPILGTEFPDVQVADLLGDDDKIRDLAVLASRRGVLFFRNQRLTVAQQKLLTQKLGELAGKPSTSKLSKHVIFNSNMNVPVDSTGALDDEVAVNTSEAERKTYPGRFATYLRPLASEIWHSDVAYEKAPADYTVLHLVDVPELGGGDTLWASGYEMYSRLSPPIQNMVDGLNAVFSRKQAFHKLAKDRGIKLNSERGAPENTGLELESTHPVVRTNPVTGWKSLWATGAGVEDGWIEGITRTESDMLKGYFRRLMIENHDLQVRFKWKTNDLALWDNRSTFHTPTYDYEGSRRAHRITSLGEVPYYDPASKAQRESLAQEV